MPHQVRLVWFLEPAPTSESFQEAWERCGSDWTPPPKVLRWVRCAASRRRLPLLHGSTFGAVEEFWCFRHEADAVRLQILDRQDGLAGRLSGVVNADKSPCMITEDRVVIDGPECIGQGGLRQIALIARTRGLSRQAFFDHWHGVHGPLVRRGGGLSRYVQGRIDDGDGTGYDGLGHIFFSDLDEVSRFAASSAYLGDQHAEDGPTFVDMATVLAVTTDRQWEASKSD